MVNLENKEILVILAMTLQAFEIKLSSYFIVLKTTHYLVIIIKTNLTTYVCTEFISKDGFKVS